MERFGSKKRGSARNSALVLSMQTPLSSARHGAKDAGVVPQPLFLFRVPLFGFKLCTHKIHDSHSFGVQHESPAGACFVFRQSSCCFLASTNATGRNSFFARAHARAYRSSAFGGNVFHSECPWRWRPDGSKL